MARNGSGTYNLPAGNPVVTNTTISSTWANSTLSDIATALTQSLAKDGQTVPTANLPMGGYKHTGAGDAVGAGQYLVYGQDGGVLGDTTFTGLVAANESTPIASGSTIDLSAATGNDVTVTHSTGDTAVASFGAASALQAGTRIRILASISGGTLTLTHNATSMIIPGGADWLLADGDSFDAVKISDSQAYWRIENITLANGKALVDIAGKVLQVVQGKTSTPVTNATAGFVATGLSASITPSSATSKILVLVNQQTYSTRTANSSGYGFRVLRDSTVIQAANSDNSDNIIAAGGASAVNYGGVQAASVLDSPATTSALTYSVKARPNSTANSGSITHQFNNSVSSITLMEIAA